MRPAILHSLARGVTICCHDSQRSLIGPSPWRRLRPPRDREGEGGGARRQSLELPPDDMHGFTVKAKAAALGGVGPRHARRPEAADRWSPGRFCMVTRDRASAGRAYEAPGCLLSVTRGQGERAGRRPRTDGGDPGETADAGSSRGTARQPTPGAPRGRRDSRRRELPGTPARQPTPGSPSRTNRERQDSGALTRQSGRSPGRSRSRRARARSRSRGPAAAGRSGARRCACPRRPCS
jgi:hypothetical protein